MEKLVLVKLASPEYINQVVYQYEMSIFRWMNARKNTCGTNRTNTIRSLEKFAFLRPVDSAAEYSLLTE